VGEVTAAHVSEDPKGRLYTVAPGYRLAGVKPAGGDVVD